MSQSISAESPGSKTRRTWILIPAFTCLLAVAGVFCTRLEATDTPTVEQLRRQTVSFTENRGQWDSQVLYRAANSGSTMWFTKDGIYYQFTRVKQDQSSGPVEQIDGRESRKIEQMIIKATFVGANVNPAVSSDGPMEYKCNYFLGNDSAKWQTDVPNYEAVIYHGLYEGIDLKFSGNQGKMVSEIVAAPGADYQQIKLRYDGAKSISVSSTGEILVETEWGTMIAPVPTVYQDLDGSKGTITISNEKVDDQTLRLAITGDIDESNTIFMAPALTFSTYLGGSSSDDGKDVAVNGASEAYVVGYTYSANFPAVSGYDNSVSSQDGYVTKFSASGSSLIFSTYLGGTSFDECSGMSLTGSGNYGIFLTGTTQSSDFPMVNAIDATANGSSDAFVASLGPAGNSLTFATYLGGTGTEYSYDIATACAATGCTIDKYTVWVVGSTNSPDFPTALAYDVTLGGTSDAFLTSYTVGITGNSLGRSTYFGGSNVEAARSIVLVGSIPVRPYVCGSTYSSDLPMAGPYDNALNGTRDWFIAGFAYAGNGLMYPQFSTYFGGNEGLQEYPTSIIVRSSGNICVVGVTDAPGLGIATSFDSTRTGGWDGFVVEFNNAASALISCTYLGGTSQDEVWKIIEKNSNLYITGSTSSTDFPTFNPYDGTNGGGKDVFFSIFNPSMSALLFSTFIGGSGTDEAYGMALDNSGCSYIAGRTLSSDFPMTIPYDPVNADNYDSFLAKICVPLYICGDADGSGIVTISDAVLLINYIFAGGPAPNPLLSGDADCSGSVTISDAVYLINYIFAGGAAPCASCP